MAAPSVTNTFTNGTTADATEVNQNFTDVINGITDGTKDLTISAFTANGAAVFNGTVTLGNATGDDVVFTGYVASTIIPKTNAAYDLGSQTLNWQALYLDNDSTDGGAIYFDADGTTFLKCAADGVDILLDGATTFSVDATLQAQTDATSALGSTSIGWTGLYLDNGATDGGGIYFNSGSTAFLKSDASGADLAMGGFTGLDLAGAMIKEYGLYHEAKSADYTVTDTDGVSIILMTTGASDRTITLPTAADNSGRVLEIKKVDSGVGLCILDGEGAETIDDIATFEMRKQWDSCKIICDGTEWHLLHFHTTEEIVTEDTSLRTQGSAVTGTWYNNGSISISLLKGTWDVSYSASCQVSDSVNMTQADVSVTLSTANNSESDATHTSYAFEDESNDEILTFVIPMYRRIRITVASTTTYYLNIKTDQGGTAPDIHFRGEKAPTLIQATRLK